MTELIWRQLFLRVQEWLARRRRLHREVTPLRHRGRIWAKSARGGAGSAL